MILKLKWSFGNAKLKKTDTVSFNLPAYKSAGGFKTCPKALECVAVCYARQGRYMMPTVQAPREFNLEIARSDKLYQYLLCDLNLIRQNSIRVHDSGDFFSQKYLDTWYAIARKYPRKRFYAYTKSLHLDLFGNKPDNFTIIQSAGGKLPVDTAKPHARIFATHADRKRAGYIDGNISDKPAQDGVIKIGLVYHGQRKLTEQQTETFSV